MNQDVVDLNEVLERVQNDKDLLLELFDIFLEDCPAKIASLKDAVSAKDLSKLRDVAHSMKGASANIAAKRINASFLQMEQLAKNNTVTGIEQLLKDIDGQINDLKVYAQKLKMEFKKK